MSALLLCPPCSTKCAPETHQSPCATGGAGRDPGGTIRRAGRGRRGCCPSTTRLSRPLPSLALFPTPELFVKACQSALVVLEGDAQKRGWQWMGSAAQTGANCAQKGSLGLGRAGSGHCLSAETGGTVHHALPSPPQGQPGADVPPEPWSGSGATEQTAGSALGLMARDEFTP